MPISSTYTLLKARDAKHRLGRAVAHATTWGIAAIGLTASPGFFQDAVRTEDPAIPLFAGIIAAAGIVMVGRLTIKRLLKPVYVTANNFDAIEDELGGFDSDLLELFQACHGSRPQKDFDAFMENAIGHKGPTDFNSALFYLQDSSRERVGQRLCYDFDSVSRLVEASQLCAERRKQEGADDNGTTQNYSLSHQHKKPKTLFEHFQRRPVMFTLGLCILGSAIASSLTAMVFFYA